MSDEPADGVPDPGGPVGPEGATEPEPPAPEPEPPAPEPAPPGRLTRVLPHWARRRPLAAAVGAGVLAAAVIAGVVLLVVRPSAPQPRYASLPGQSCALVSPADVAKYLPGAKGTPQSTGQSSTAKAGVCKWSAPAGGEDRTLLV